MEALPPLHGGPFMSNGYAKPPTDQATHEAVTDILTMALEHAARFGCEVASLDIERFEPFVNTADKPSVLYAYTATAGYRTMRPK